MPCPPEVPGNQLAMKAVDSLRMLSTNMGLPDNRTLIRGIFLSTDLTSSITSFSNVEKSTFKVLSWDAGA